MRVSAFPRHRRACYVRRCTRAGRACSNGRRHRVPVGTGPVPPQPHLHPRRALMATTYLTPGVYVEEVASSSATLTAGATAIAAFVGFTEKAPTDDPADPEGIKPRLVTSWTQFESLYGGIVPGIMLPHSVYGYFNNGGSIAYIVRVPNTVPATEPGTLALPAADRTLGPAVEFTTVEPNADIAVSVTPVAPAED